MCLVAIAWRAHPRYPLVIAGNRDEFHERPSAAADWWPDVPGVLGGRDLVAGGSWLALNRGGRFALVTNHPGRPGGPERPASRGALVRDWVGGVPGTAPDYLDGIAGREQDYGGFCVVIGTLATDPEGLIIPAGPAGARWRLPVGVTALANGPRENPQPRASWLEDEYRRLLAVEEPDPDTLLAPLLRTAPVEAVSLGGDWRARARVTPFVSAEVYGTRATTLVMVSAAGEVCFREDRFGPAGVPAGRTEQRFRIT